MLSGGSVSLALHVSAKIVEQPMEPLESGRIGVAIPIRVSGLEAEQSH